MAYVILCGSVAAYLLWFRLVTVYGATAASAYHFLMPPLGMLFGWILLGEHVHAPDLLGVVPVAAGIWLVTRPPHSRRQTYSESSRIAADSPARDGAARDGRPGGAGTQEASGMIQELRTSPKTLSRILI
jgi:hypothetical protein